MLPGPAPGPSNPPPEDKPHQINIMLVRVAAKKIRKKKFYMAQCIPFVEYIKDLKGFSAQISESVCAKVIEKYSVWHC